MRALEQLHNLGAREAATDVETGKLSVEDGRERIQETIDVLMALDERGQSTERKNLLGSAYKRLSVVQRSDGNHRGENEALREAVKHYRLALDLNHPDFYPAVNILAAQLAARFRGGEWSGLDANVREAASVSIADTNGASPTFWSVLAQPELKLYEALAQDRVAEVQAALLEDYERIHDRVSSSRHWKSHLDTVRWVVNVGPGEAKPEAVEQAEWDAISQIIAVLTEYAEA